MKKITIFLVLSTLVLGLFAQNVRTEITDSKMLDKYVLLRKHESKVNSLDKSSFTKNKNSSFVQFNKEESNKIKSYSQLKNWVLSEGFENMSAPLPQGWRTISTSDLIGSDATSTDWTTGTNTWAPINEDSFGEGGEELVYEGIASVAIGASAGMEGNPFSWLVTPEVTLPEDEAFLYFNLWYANLAENDWLTNFYVNVLSNGQWETILSLKGSEGAEANMYYEPIVLNLSKYLGQNVTFAFVHEYTNGFQIAMDNIFVGNQPENDIDVSISVNNEEPFFEGDRILFSADVENLGSNAQSNVSVKFNLNDVETLVKTISSIKPGEIKTVYFPWTIEKGTTEIKAILSEEDDVVENNKDVFIVNALSQGQLYENFDGDIFPPMYWSTNIINDHDWILGQGYNSYASALYVDSDSLGVAELVTPLLDLTVSNSDSISFYYSSYGFEGLEQDSLEILISTDDGVNWERIDFLGRQNEFVLYTYTLENYSQTSETYIKFVAYDHNGFDIRIDQVTGPKINIQSSEAGLSKFENIKFNSAGFVTEGLREIKVELKNYGSGNLTSAKINFEIIENENVFEQPAFNWTGEMLPGETEVVNIGSFKFIADNGYVVNAYISESNGSEDMYKENNEVSTEFTATITGQLCEDFEGNFPPIGWKIINNGSPEAFYQEPYSVTPESYYCACTPFSSTGVPNNDWLVTPKLAPTSTNNRFTFWAISFGNESLDIKISTTGNNASDFDVFVGNILPGEQYEWYGYSIDLSQYIGQKVYIAFKNTNGTMGAIAIDNVMGPIVADLGDDDLSINEVIYPNGYTYVGENVSVKAVIQNTGTSLSSSRDLKFLVNGTEKGTTTVGEIIPGDYYIIEIEYTPEKIGLQTIEVKFATDDSNNENNSNAVDIVVADYKMLTEGFEGDKVPAGWKFGNWYAGTYESAVEGSNIAVCALPYGYENVILASPKLKIDGTYSKMYFYAHGINFYNNSYTSIKMVYSEDGENWSALSDSANLTPEMELYQFDLSEIKDGEYYLGFAASSTFNYENYEGLAIVDFVFGPEIIKTRAISYTPAEGESDVEKDAQIFVVFDRDIDEIDLYGVTVEGSVDGVLKNVEAFITDDKRTILISHDPFSNTPQRYKVFIPENSVMEVDGIYNNSKTSWNFITGNTTAVKDIKDFAEFNVYPNPVSDKLFINAPEFDRGATITISSISGSVVVYKAVEVEINEIEVSNLQTGVYIIMLNDGNKIAINKFIKK